MPVTEVMPIVMGALVAAYVIHLSVRSGEKPFGGWLLPAGAASCFAFWTLMAAVREGPTGFWPEHTRNLWGNQIWFDLLFAAAVALTFMMPRARRLGMRLAPWTLLVLGTGSIGLLAMFARIIYLEEKQVSARRDGAGSLEKV